VNLDLFAGIRVSDYEAARPWYERLFGSEPSFVAHETECVWELDATVAEIASRGIEPDERVTYPGKARKAIYHDRYGNEISFGGPTE